jgi:hypothetical protein
MNMTRAGIVFAILFSTSVVAFNNCAGNGFNAPGALDSAGLGSSQCRTKVISSAKTELFSNPSLCESAANYQCDLRRFRKGVGTEQKHDIQCAQIAGIGEACIPVVTYNFDTTTQQQTAEASELIEGGSYNRDEVSCINTQITSQHIALIQVEGASVPETLEKSIETCRQRSRQ